MGMIGYHEVVISFILIHTGDRRTNSASHRLLYIGIGAHTQTLTHYSHLPLWAFFRPNRITRNKNNTS
ncbi:hypothetical protein L6452_40035 [Arctium lappa]|uniref:Uncharacterized protein n=1 Tax=Arctium lappa TaxID=4217 RepID=A0ACB8XTG5_ARCLA|nr:hypothetical protein L6452_40035 [Arctium lappa]